MKKHLILSVIILASGSAMAQKGFAKKEAKIPAGQTAEKMDVTNFNDTLNLGLLPKFALNGTSDNLEIVSDGNAIIFMNAANNVNLKKQRSSKPISSLDFIANFKTELKLKSPKDEFTLVSEQKDIYGITHARYQQNIHGTPIYGGEAVIHSNKLGDFETLNGRIYESMDLNVSPSIDAEGAIKLGLNHLNAFSIVQPKKGLFGMANNSAELFVKIIDSKPKLVYHLVLKPNVLERWVLFLDAISGEVLEKYNHTCTLDGVYSASSKDLNNATRSFGVIQKGSSYYMIDAQKKMYDAKNSTMPDNPNGVIWTIDGLNSKSNSTNMNFDHITSASLNSWNATAVSAHTNAEICYDYYTSVHNRNSLNGSGGNIISVINIADDNGQGMDNAYWNGEFMGYGNGNKYFKPLAGALDVAGHEMTHGVIENTAKLDYSNQSGAMNESFADIFGTLIDRTNWLIGEGVIKPGIFPGGALRSLENPNQTGPSDPGYQPKFMSQYKFLANTDAGDNGGVHINSGIPNFAYYKFATGTGMDKNKAEKVYYQVLTQYLTRTSNFVDLRLAVIQATKSIYGAGAEMNAAIAAFNEVGIVDPNASSGGGTTGGGTTGGGSSSTGTVITANPGAENLVVYDPVADALYSLPAKPNFTSAELINIADKYGCLGKPSITDNGSFVYFVGKDYNIYRVNLSTKTKPDPLTNDAQWRNVAVSKNGKLLAAFKRHDATGKIVFNPNMYLFNLENNNITKTIQLYNPTYSSGVSTGQILYADSFEWDYSGENVIYDAYNELKGITSTINYWDVGIVKVFDATANNFMDKGIVQKVFSNLKNGENIGNPSISKTNTNIIAFDYYYHLADQANSDKFRIFVIDFDKSKILDSLENDDVGYPNFSKSDDILWFNGASKTTNSSVVKAFGLKSQAFVNVGQTSVIFEDAQWTSPYALGSRTLPSKQSQIISVTAIADKAANATVEILAKTSSNLPLTYTLVSGDATLNGNVLKLGTTPGKVIVNVIQVGNTSYATASSEISFCISPAAAMLTDNGESVMASGGSNYQYYVNNNPVGGVTTSNTLKKDFGGNYTVKNVTSDGCYSTVSNSVTVSALGTLVEANTIKISPNPAENFIKIEVPNNELLKNFSIMDILGKTVLEGNQNLVNVSRLNAGIYIIKVQTSGNTYSSKLVKK